MTAPRFTFVGVPIDSVGRAGGRALVEALGSAMSS
jgi:hypothetical protein